MQELRAEWLDLVPGPSALGYLLPRLQRSGSWGDWFPALTGWAALCRAYGADANDIGTTPSQNELRRFHRELSHRLRLDIAYEAW